MGETGVQCLGQEDPLEKKMATNLSIFFFFNLSILPESPTDGGAWQATVHGVTKSRTRQSNFTFTFLSIDRLLQDIEYSPLCYTVDLCSLLILDMCVYAGVLSC